MLNKGAVPGPAPVSRPSAAATPAGPPSDALAALPDTIDHAPVDEAVGLVPAWLLLSAIAGGTLALAVGSLVAVLVYLIA